LEKYHEGTITYSLPLFENLNGKREKLINLIIYKFQIP